MSTFRPQIEQLEDRLVPANVISYQFFGFDLVAAEGQHEAAFYLTQDARLSPGAVKILNEQGKPLPFHQTVLEDQTLVFHFDGETTTYVGLCEVIETFNAPAGHIYTLYTDGTKIHSLVDGKQDTDSDQFSWLVMTEFEERFRAKLLEIRQTVPHRPFLLPQDLAVVTAIAHLENTQPFTLQSEREVIALLQPFYSENLLEFFPYLAGRSRV